MCSGVYGNNEHNLNRYCGYQASAKIPPKQFLSKGSLTVLSVVQNSENGSFIAAFCGYSNALIWSLLYLSMFMMWSKSKGAGEITWIHRFAWVVTVCIMYFEFYVHIALIYKKIYILCLKGSLIKLIQWEGITFLQIILRYEVSLNNG